MGACATKPGDLKVKGEAPLVVEDAAAVPVVVVLAGEEKAKAADGAVMAAAEADPADASRRRSLSDLLKQDAETSDGEAGEEETEKAVAAVEPATTMSAAGDDEAGATTVGAQAPVQASAATDHGDVPAAVEEEKRVDPDSVQVVVPAAADAVAAPSAEVADDASA